MDLTEVSLFELVAEVERRGLTVVDPERAEAVQRGVDATELINELAPASLPRRFRSASSRSASSPF